MPFDTIQSQEENTIMNAHISRVEMGVEPLTCGFSEFCPLSQTSPREEELVTGLAVDIVISTTPTQQHFPLFHSHSISSSLPSNYTLSLCMNNASLTRTQNS